jgi:hypothetical protein
MPVSDTGFRDAADDRREGSSRQTAGRSAVRPAAFMRWLTDMLATFYHGVNDGRRLMGDYEALGRLHDDELAKRGLTRAAIGKALRTLRREG